MKITETARARSRLKKTQVTVINPAPARIWASLMALTCVLATTPSWADPSVSVNIGPTPVPGGNARATNDISVSNQHFTLSFAVGTEPPWGAAPGGLIDIGVSRDGKLQPDFVSLIDFLPNGWQAGSYLVAAPTATKISDNQVQVVTERGWGDLRFRTTFTVFAGSDAVLLETVLRNAGERPSATLNSGYAVWPDGGHIFGFPGLALQEEGVRGSAAGKWSAFYDREWAIALHADYDTLFINRTRDRFLSHTLNPGDSISFRAELQIVGEGNLAPVMLHRSDSSAGHVTQLSGSVSSSDGATPADSVIMITSLDGDPAQPVGWIRARAGQFAATLPRGRYQAYAAAPGYARSSAVDLEFSGHNGADNTYSLDFNDLAPPGYVHLAIKDLSTGLPLDARIEIVEGPQPVVGFFGESVFYTELSPRGELDMTLAPGNYRLNISNGGGFTSAPIDLDLTIASGDEKTQDIRVHRLIDPAARNWYTADLHHHSDVLDGYTEPQYVFRSQLAAGLDLTFLSDHDSTINNAAMAEMADARGIPFIPATELSPSWAHFNAYPIGADERIAISVGQASAQTLFAEARRMGADVVQVNHPFTEYGYFRSREGSAIPGGYSDAFDVVEISSTYSNDETVPAVWRLWNQGQRAYFAAGSDVHNVWQEISGAVRTFAQLEEPPTAISFVEAVKNGRTYASAGPLIFPAIPFGSRLKITLGEPLELRADLASVTGLARISLIERGAIRETRELGGATEAIGVVFSPAPHGDTWFALVVEDVSGRQALSNPWWVVSAGDASAVGKATVFTERTNHDHVH